MGYINSYGLFEKCYLTNVSGNLFCSVLIRPGSIDIFLFCLFITVSRRHSDSWYHRHVLLLVSPFSYLGSSQLRFKDVLSNFPLPRSLLKHREWFRALPDDFSGVDILSPLTLCSDLNCPKRERHRRGRLPFNCPTATSQNRDCMDSPSMVFVILRIW